MHTNIIIYRMQKASDLNTLKLSNKVKHKIQERIDLAVLKCSENSLSDSAHNLILSDDDDSRGTSSTTNP
jgi:hypothetical protein